MEEKSKIIFGNPVSEKTYRKAVRGKKKYQRKYGDDSNADYPVKLVKNAVLNAPLGVEDIRVAEGRGERLTTLPDAPRFYAVLCKPDFDVSTPELFSRVRGGAALSRPDTAGMLDALRRGDAAGVLARVGNVFEGVLPAERAAEVRAIRERLLSLGAGAAAMTGSGPTVFGLFWDEAAAESAYAALSRDYARTFLARFV